MVALYMLAALAEIAGCYAFWAWARQDQSVLWLVPGVALLAFFAFVLTQVESNFAGRAYAAYGGVYIVGSLVWLLVVERVVPDRWDMIGGTISLIGALVIVYGPHVKGA